MPPMLPRWRSSRATLLVRGGVPPAQAVALQMIFQLFACHISSFPGPVLRKRAHISRDRFLDQVTQKLSGQAWAKGGDAVKGCFDYAAYAAALAEQQPDAAAPSR